jgi:hypothetical protein
VGLYIRVALKVLYAVTLVLVYLISQRLTTAFRKKLDGIKDVWRHLPQKVCGGQTFVSRDRNESCWNGIEMQK